jgi:hypothetical protein
MIVFIGFDIFVRYKLMIILLQAKKYCEIDLATTTIKVDNKEKRYKNLDFSEDLCLRTWLIWNIAEKIFTVLLKQCYNMKSIIG